ncbi:DUF3137 domain-containing protein [Nocardioides sp. TRM66260-LWL]|uniref:DUF3137 domain-containing protein n=1 Tax=Nocardioides sp. TRM66260-LWL TaxID=2874478 RepID=UPI001CC464AC|nr:DUF3137 domain-containing protein [Nocardioides sp. TRM66260-LWL]MBZ5736236.1 DUF3137 domain-containing protein [Nocardioides sp. TRM66260-LWL]
MIVLAFVGALALIALVAWLSYRAEQRHRAALTAFATARGWSLADSDPSLVHRFSGEPFGRGFGRRTRHVLRGTHAGRPFVVFDYVHKTRDGSGENARTVTHRHCLTVIELGVRTPGLVVDPENVLERFAGRLLNTDIELESEEFNRAFRVNSRDRRFASAVLHPRMMEHLLHLRDLGWRIEDDAMILVERGSYEVDGVETRLAMLASVLDLVPDFVWDDLRGGRG